MSGQEMKIPKIFITLIRLAFSIFLGIEVLSGGFQLLMWGKISGTEFVTLTIGIIIICLAIAMIGNIEELSVGGNIIKLREAKKEADDTLEEIHNAQANLFTLMLLQSRKISGAFDTIRKVKDPRVDGFWKTYEAIKNAKLDKKVRTEILDTANFMRLVQLQSVEQLSSPSVSFREANHIVSAEELLAAALDGRLLQQSSSKDSDRKMIIEAVDEYRKLLDLYYKYQ